MKRKVSSFFLITLALVMVLGTTVLPVQRVNAASDLGDELNSIIENYNDTTSEVSEKVKNQYLDLAKDEIKNGNVLLHIPDNVGLNYEDAIVKKVNGSFYMVKINYLEDGGYHEFSGISMSFDSNGELVQHFELQMKEIDENSGKVISWYNGEKNLDQVVETPNNGDVSTYSWSGFVDCLNSAGVSAWAVAALSIACGALCVGTAGAGCAPCLYAASSITGGTLGWCIGSNL